jgi:hypothetical protein
MSIACPRCNRVLEFRGEPPSFCSYCGNRLNLTPTEAFDPEVTAEAPRAGHSPAMPESVGGYRILRELGAGGMGTVYEAVQVVTGRRVALKLIAADFVDSPDAVARFRQEGRLASAIAHPRCVFVLAADEEAGRPYIVMELMPGNTLETLVQQQGPLPPEQAVAKILDVIEGLQAVHRLGVVHRDVKPSNCFLEADGRVKVGDFGLAKSLVKQAHLTRTGSFLGTLLFCSPEQLRGQPVNQQSDVYSVSATLYYLLTGQAPFQADDPAAVVARVVSEPVPPPRALRPGIPASMERVVLRGLERDRQRRWRTLDDLRVALLPFAPGGLSIGGVGLRFAAFLFDSLVLATVAVTHGRLAGAIDSLSVLAWAYCYYALPEGLWGCTLGKLCLGLRVRPVGSSDPPGLVRGALRTGIWLLLLLWWLPAYLVRGNWQPCLGLFCLLAITGPMHEGNGNRCLHDILSGTRVVRLPAAVRRRSWVDRHFDLEALASPDAVDRLGGYVVRGALGPTGSGRVLLAEDPGLDRQVLLWVRPRTEPSLDARLRQLSRPTRLRWLGAGQQEDVQWDGFLAPSGCPLAELVTRRGRLSWAETRPLLQQLAWELAEAEADGTLPQSLTLGQVWVREDGQLLLLDVPLGVPGDGPTAGATLVLLRQVAVLALEGRPRQAGASPVPIRAPLPEHAGLLLNRLLGCALPPANASELQPSRVLLPPRSSPVTSVQQVLDDLSLTCDKPTEVSRPQRGTQLAVHALVVAIWFSMMSAQWAVGKRFPPTPSELLRLSELVLILPVIWAFLVRGGLSLSLFGLVLVRGDGRLAARWQCAWRALLAWIPITILLPVSIWLDPRSWFAGEPIIAWWTSWVIWFLIAGCVVMPLWQPSRGLHDRLAGTYLVPR